MSRARGYDPVQTVYESKDVAIPEDYLRADPPDAAPMKFSKIDFEKTDLPQYKGAYAVVIDHVLSPSECATLLKLAEASVPDENRRSGGGGDGDGDGDDNESEGDRAWSPALVNVGGGYEVLVPEYRNSDRIIWDSQEIVDRLWARLARVPEVQAHLGGSLSNGDLLGARRKPAKETFWDFHRVNQRMRFLRYGPGQFFRPHCDGVYSELDGDGGLLRTHFTLHLYLNDSQQEVGEGAADLRGGATSFLSSDEKKKVDVDPRAGRVLIFQHQRLYHSGDDVKQGIKYTVRSDILYKLREDGQHTT